MPASFCTGLGHCVLEFQFTTKLMAVIDISLLIFCYENQFENPSGYKDKVIATGLPASPGAAVGQIVFTAEDAEAWHAQGKDVILVRPDHLSF